MKQKSGKALSLLLVLCMLVSMFSGLSITASAAAVETVAVELTGKDGKTASTLATWTFDSANQTYKDNATGSELVIVRDYSSAPLVYTGLNKKPDPRCLSVTTKGIPLEELYTYASKLAGGIDLRGDTAMYISDATGYKDEFTYDQYWGLTRYNYMNWYNADTYAAASAENCNDGVEVPSTLAIVGYHNARFADGAATPGELAAKADSFNSLRISLGMQKDGNKTIADSWIHTGNNGGNGDINEGNLSVKNINVIRFTPVYTAFTVENGVVGGTEGEGGFGWKASNATITTADNWAKAAAGETVTFTVTPDSGYAVKHVYASQGSADIAVQDKGGNVYTFEMPAPKDGEKVLIKLETEESSASTGWDGSSIASPEEFAAFAEAVNGGNSFAGKTVTLADNIDLSTIADWVPVGDAAHPFAGIFDGAGKTVSGLTITDVTGGYHGLFGYVTGTVKDFTVVGTIGTAEAKITSGADNIGGAVGYNDGTVSGVTGNVTVYVKTSSIYAVGGVVGQNGQTGVIRKCANTANVEGTKHTGGVCGRNYGTIDSCYNTGNITGNGGGKDGIGGIVGLAGNKDGTYANSVTNCYNTGTISNNNGRWHGGIVGMTDKAATVKNCYNVGIIEKGYSWNWNPIIGHVDGGAGNPATENNYSLEGLNAGDTTDATKPLTIGTVKAEDEMKTEAFAALLGEAFKADGKNINNGFAILAWQDTGSEPKPGAAWDGKTIDVSWYNTTDKEFHISTPEQLMGLAAIVNGKYNSDITTVIGDDDHTKIVAHEVNFNATTGGTNDGWRGADDFEGKTIYLDADLDMGGVYNSESGTWSGARFMPISGAYRLDSDDATTQLNSVWGGVFDGQGHKVYNIYASLSNTSWAESVGFIGRIGCHDKDEVALRPSGAAVRNLAVDGYIEADRSVGGIVGKIGQTNGGAVIENCINFATVVGHQKKCTGGIVGAAWNGGVIRNCLNAGSVINVGQNELGGITGGNEIRLINCYNIGKVTGKTGSTTAAIATHASGSYENCYWLTGTADVGVYGTTTTEVHEKSEAEMKAADFLAAINGNGRAWVADTANYNNGYPIPRVFAGADTATITNLTTEGEPTTVYYEDQGFGANTFKIWANYSDSTREAVETFTVKLGGTEIDSAYKFVLADNGKALTIEVSYGGQTGTYGPYTVEVKKNVPTEITKVISGPSPMLYRVGETIKAENLAAYVVFANGTKGFRYLKDDPNLSLNLTAPLTAEDNGRTLSASYTLNETSVSCDVGTIEVVAAVEQDANGVYQIKTATDLRWFAAAINDSSRGNAGALNAKLVNDIDLSEVTDWNGIGTSTVSTCFNGEFDGNGKTLTFKDTVGLFGYVGTGKIHDLTIAGAITGQGGVAARITGAGRVENCVNNATITGNGSGVGGVVGTVNVAEGVVSGCVNTGAVTATANYSGGVVGQSKGNITNCLNSGSVSGTNHVGGIVGAFNGTDSTLSGCANTGAVTGTGDKIGGIIGNLYKNIVTNCYNSGSVTGTASGATKGVGGIVGGTQGAATVSNSYNVGTVTGAEASAAALIGYDAKGAVLTNCYYLGTGEDAFHGVGGSSTTENDTVSAKTEDEMKAAEIIALLNGESGTAFAADSGISALNGGYPVLSWQLKGVAMAVTFNVTPSTAKIVVKAADDSTVQPIEENGRVYALVLNEEYTYYITAPGYTGVSDRITPAGNVTVTITLTETGGSGGNPGGTGNVNAAVWDGKSIDVSWYTPDADEYYISTPAQLAGLAAIVNGIYNSEIDTFAGDTSYIVDNRGYSSGSGPNGMNQSTPNYHFGSDNFEGKTVHITDDINMGSANYMPIGGQYLMTKDDTTTRIDASFCGVFDGGGHKITINCNRHCTINYGDGQSVGLIGRLGVHDNEDSSKPTGAAVRNVAVYGSVYANRSVGGVVGKTGRGIDTVIEGCANFASVKSTDSKGVGGVVGAAWNGPVIRNCYNAGNVETLYPTGMTGGIAGSNEATVINCFNVGKITGPAGNDTSAIASDNGGSVFENCYWLTGSADSGVYRRTYDSVIEKSETEMKSSEMAGLLGDAFTTDSGGVNSGYPILKWQKTGGNTGGGGSGGTGSGKDEESVETKLPFVDVTGHWALDAIRCVYESGLFEGVSGTKFAPDMAMTRGMFVTVLYRLAGEPEVTETAEYTDVAAGDWYAKAVAWAAKNGIADGYGDSFGPNDFVTREQMAAILMRYSAWKKYDTTAGGMAIREYADYDEISDWAEAAIAWANAEGLITGRTDTAIVPRGNATRAEVATILMRFMQKFVK